MAPFANVRGGLCNVGRITEVGTCARDFGMGTSRRQDSRLRLIHRIDRRHYERRAGFKIAAAESIAEGGEEGDTGEVGALLLIVMSVCAGVSSAAEICGAERGSGDDAFRVRDGR